MEQRQIVLPGEVIEPDAEGLMCGQGVTLRGNAIVATVRGFVSRISQLRTITPITSIYSPNIGDIVVGRVEQVQNQRWLVQIGCSVLGQLRLSSIYLPNDEQRRRTTADERNMRQYFDVGDLVCAEIQQSSGAIALQTRHQHPKRLDHGILVTVPSRLIRRVPQHITTFEGDGRMFTIIYGMNGNIWVGPEDPTDPGGETITRIRSCLIFLATYNRQIYPDALLRVFELTHDRAVSEIVSPQTAEQLDAANS